MTSGYCDCACRDCFEIAIGDSEKEAALCWVCEEAGCSDQGNSECDKPGDWDDIEDCADCQTSTYPHVCKVTEGQV